MLIKVLEKFNKTFFWKVRSWRKLLHIEEQVKANMASRWDITFPRTIGVNGFKKFSHNMS